MRSQQERFWEKVDKGGPKNQQGEPAPPKPMSAWQQFKALIHEVFP